MGGFEAFWAAVWFVITFLFAAVLFLVGVTVLAYIGFRIALVLMTKEQAKAAVEWLERKS